MSTSLLRKFESIRLDKNSSVPIYQQIAEGIADLIKRGALPPGSLFPAERTLCETFDISRMTLREATRLLENDGLLESYQGRGRFVAARRLRKQQQEMKSFTEEIRARGGVPSSRLLSFALREPDTQALTFFNLKKGDKIYEIRRLRLRDEIPLAVEEVHISQRLCPGLDRFDLSRNSLYAILEDSYGLALEHSVEEISAELASNYERKQLEIPRSLAVLVVNRKSYADAGQPLELTRAAYRGDLYSAIIHSVRVTRSTRKYLPSA
jgi:GntR family transcriptional regulator